MEMDIVWDKIDPRWLALGAFVLAVQFAQFRQARRMKTENKSKPQRVGVGIGVVVYKPHSGEFLMGLRKGSHGADTWALPGGWLEVGESFEECALREVEEEVGLTRDALGAAQVIDVAPSNNIMPTVHSVSVFVKIPLLDEKAQPRVMEPDKCHRWEWYSSRKGEYPSNIFPSAGFLLVKKQLSL